MPRPEIPAEDGIRMTHMLDAARHAVAFSVGRGREALDTDAMYRRAVTSCLREIGEAANRVAPQTWLLVPTVPWQQITGMRNRLVTFTSTSILTSYGT